MLFRSQPIKATFHFFISAFLHCVSIVMPGNLFPGLGSALDAGCGDSLHEELLGKHEEDDDREGQEEHAGQSLFSRIRLLIL